MEESQLHIPEGWEGKELGNLYLEKRKSKFKVSDATNYGGIPFYTSGDAVLEHNEMQTDGENIFLATGGIANVKFYNGKVAYSTDTYVIVGKENISTQFLYFKILGQLYYINTNYFQGSGLKHLQKKDFRKHLFALPKTEIEQTTIANILSKTAQAIANTEALIAKYTQIKTGLMQDLLTKGIDENGNIRTEQTHEFKDSPLGRIPKEWDVVNLKQIGTKNSSYLRTGPFGSSLKGEHWKESGVPVITIGSLGDGIFLKENLLYVSNDKAFELLSYQLIEGDILFSRVAEIGRSIVIKAENVGWIMSSNFMRLRLELNAYLPEFLNLIIKHSSSFQKQVAENVNESGRSVTNSKILNSFLFPKVSIEEQHKILEKIKSLNQIIISFETELLKLQSLKTGLMQDLLSGKVRVNNLMTEKQN